MENIPQDIMFTIKKMAKKHYPKANKNLLDIEDLVNQGICAYLLKIKQYDQSLRIKPLTFCYMRINGAIMDKIKDSVPTTQDQNKTAAALRQINIDHDYKITQDEAIVIYEKTNKPKRRYRKPSISSLSGIEYDKQKLEINRQTKNNCHYENPSQNLQRQEFWQGVEKLLTGEQFNTVKRVILFGEKGSEQEYKRILLKLKGMER